MSTLLPAILLTLVCTDQTLTQCEVYQSRWPNNDAREKGAATIRKQATQLGLKETISFVFTDDANIHKLPFKPRTSADVEKYQEKP